MNLPVYLRSPELDQVTYIYGVLKFEELNRDWIIEGEPIILEMAKRLFPGCNSRTPGQARFKANKRTTGELNWLMQRFPLKIEDPDIYRQHLTQTQDLYRKRTSQQTQPRRTSAPPTFIGTLTPFQEEGLTFLEINHEGCLLADDMGLGKTVQALAFLSKMEAFPAIIVPPPHLVRNWSNEVNKFLRLPPLLGQTANLFENGNPPIIHVIKGLRPYPLPKAHIYICHYLLLRGWKHALPEYDFKAVIFDEIQELRRRESDKYSAASLLAESAESVIGLSGTPIYNKGGEIHNVINILEYHALGDWEGFTREWCTYYGSDIVNNPALLGDHLKREGLMLRRTKDQVLTELPAKRRVIQVIDHDEGVYGELIAHAANLAAQMDATKDALERGRLTREAVGAARQATGVAKAPQVCTFVKALLEAGERILLFAHHHAVFDIYMEELKEFNPVKITGAESKNEKGRSEDAFMTGETNVCIISLRAAAGLNLQRANIVVFGELDWSPAVHSQAEDRAHRMGQKDSVLAYYLVSETGIDEEMQEALGLKVSQFIGLMGDKEESEDDKVLAQTVASEHMKSIMEKLKQRLPQTKAQRKTG